MNWVTPEAKCTKCVPLDFSKRSDSANKNKSENCIAVKFKSKMTGGGIIETVFRC